MRSPYAASPAAFKLVGLPMRLVSWFGGFVVIIAITLTAAAVSTAHQRGAPRVLTASHEQFSVSSYETLDPGVAAPHHTPPSPTPSAPPPASAPAAPPAAAAPPAVPPAPPAPPAPPPAPALIVNSTQQALINQDRARNGLAPLTWSNCLYSVASAQAAHLATPGVAFQHYGGAQQDLSCGLGQQAGENIGWWSQGVNDTQLNTMFMNSPEHYANIMGPYHYVATAWVVASNGYGYVAVEFS